MWSLVLNGLTSGMPCTWEGLLQEAKTEVTSSLCSVSLVSLFLREREEKDAMGFSSDGLVMLCLQIKLLA